jgi:hypothetical protein
VVFQELLYVAPTEEQMLQLVEFPSVDCDGTDAEEILGDLLTCAEMLQVMPGLYIGKVAVVIRPGENLFSLHDRFHDRVRKNREWIERSRDKSSKYDGIERRRTA